MVRFRPLYETCNTEGVLALGRLDVRQLVDVIERLHADATGLVNDDVVREKFCAGR